MAVQCLSTALICSGVEKTRTEVTCVRKGEHMEEKREQNLHRRGGNGSLKGKNLGGG